ncbi:MAG: 4Fe-4S dicluster domain-containing protein [Thermovirgaceae bacterium]
MKEKGRYDERDTLFARMAWREGSPAWEDYYRRNPEKKATDNALRRMPYLGGPETPTWNPLASAVIDGVFRLLADWHPQVDRHPDGPGLDLPPEDLRRWVTGAALHLGADLAATVRMKPEHYYSHRGRKEEFYGKPVEDMLPWGVVVAVSMNPEMVHCAPLAPQTAETVRGYLRAAVPSLALAYAIESAGYRARVHMDGNYLVTATRVAEDAGLGVRGRHGLLITRPYGPSVRLGVITTDMPLTASELDPAAKAVRAFCSVCGRCASLCPGGAIAADGKEEASFMPEACYKIWRTLGTDCGVCISACPFTEGAVDWDTLERAEDPVGFARHAVAGLGDRPFRKKPPAWLEARGGDISLEPGNRQKRTS